jgi:hypothetical protein
MRTTTTHPSISFTDHPCNVNFRYPSYINRVGPLSPLTINLSTIPVPRTPELEGLPHFKGTSFVAVVQTSPELKTRPFLVFMWHYGSPKDNQPGAHLKLGVEYQLALLRFTEGSHTVAFTPTLATAQVWWRATKKDPHNARMLTFSLSKPIRQELYDFTSPDLGLTSQLLDESLIPRLIPSALRVFNHGILHLWIPL